MGDKVNPALTEMAAARATAEPLPGTLADAFLSDDIQVAKDIVVRRMVASDWILLRKLNSPIVRQLLELQKPLESREPVNYTDEEAYETCFQFTRPPAEVRKALKQGREQFTEMALTEFGDKLPLKTCYEIMEAIDKQVLNYMLVTQSILPKEPEAEKKT